MNYQELADKVCEILKNHGPARDVWDDNLEDYVEVDHKKLAKEKFQQLEKEAIDRGLNFKAELGMALFDSVETYILDEISGGDGWQSSSFSC